MLSIELAKKLKDAGLKWEPRIGDAFYWHNGNGWEIDALNHADINDYLVETEDIIEEGLLIFAPRLDQLLTEIEKRGYIVETDGPYISDNEKSYLCCFDNSQYDSPCCDWCESFWRATREESVAQSLIWILEQKQATD